MKLALQYDRPSLWDLTREIGYSYSEVSGRRIASASALLDKLARAMAFPYYFGMNWAAYADSAEDIEWYCNPPGYVLVFAHADLLLRADPSTLATFIQATALARDQWRLHGLPFHLFVTGDEPVAGFMKDVDKWFPLPGYAWSSPTVCLHEERAVHVGGIGMTGRDDHLREIRDSLGQIRDFLDRYGEDRHAKYVERLLSLERTDLHGYLLEASMGVDIWGGPESIFDMGITPLAGQGPKELRRDHSSFRRALIALADAVTALGIPGAQSRADVLRVEASREYEEKAR